jgi:hypothetical protein
MDDLGIDAKDGRPVDPQVPGTVQDMDAAVAALLAKHDATRTDGKPPWPPSWAMYGTMWEERDKALREVDRLRTVNRLACEYVAARASGQSVDIGRTWEALRRAVDNA